MPGGAEVSGDLVRPPQVGLTGEPRTLIDKMRAVKRGPQFFNGTPPDLDLGHVYVELDPSGAIVRAWTRWTTEIERSSWPALQAWVTGEVAGI